MRYDSDGDSLTLQGESDGTMYLVLVNRGTYMRTENVAENVADITLSLPQVAALVRDLSAHLAARMEGQE